MSRDFFCCSFSALGMLCVYFDFSYILFIYFVRFLLHLGDDLNSVVLPVVCINIFSLGYRNIKLLTGSGTKAGSPLQ